MPTVNPYKTLAGILGILLLLVVHTTAAQFNSSAQHHQAAASQPARPVIVTLLDHTVIRGRLISVDRDAVKVEPYPHLGNPHATGEPMTIPWKTIRFVSGGLTQAKALAQWKQEHRGDLCPTCKGDGTIACPTCKGTGAIPPPARTARLARAALLVDCKTPHCDHGKIPCPNHCLQLTEGHWIMKDGLHWRVFRLRNGGGMMFSEHHLGHIIVVDNQKGTVTDAGVCPVCNGTTKIDDPVCHGTGKIPCPTCSAATDSPACPAHCDHGRITCPTCGGTGLKKS